jgi:hypothetical protein
VITERLASSGTRRIELETELRDVRGELERLTTAIAEGGNLDVPLAAIRERERATHAR